MAGDFCRAGLSCLALSVALTTAANAEPAAAGPEATHPVITAPAYRDIGRSAYALPAKQVALGGSLLGLDSTQLFAALGVSYGFGHGVQVGVNLAHMGAGLFNLAAKWTFVERGPFAVALALQPTYVHGDWVWLAPRENLFAGINAFLLPVALESSVLATAWLQFDFAARYRGGILVGDIDTQNLGLNAEIVAHEVMLQPGVRLHFLGRSSFTLAADLPLYTAAPASASVEVELEPGVVAGGQLGGTKTRPFEETYRIHAGMRTMVTEKFFIRFGLNFGPRAEDLFDSSVYPEFGVEGRFW